MKRLNSPPRAITRIKPPDIIPCHYILIEIPANDLPSRTNNSIDVTPKTVHRNHAHEDHLQHAIKAEQQYLKETFSDFTSALLRFTGEMIRWLLWRLVLPIMTVGALVVAML